MQTNQIPNPFVIRKMWVLAYIKESKKKKLEKYENWSEFVKHRKYLKCKRNFAKCHQTTSSAKISFVGQFA